MVLENQRKLSLNFYSKRHFDKVIVYVRIRIIYLSLQIDENVLFFFWF